MEKMWRQLILKIGLNSEESMACDVETKYQLDCVVVREMERFKIVLRK